MIGRVTQQTMQQSSLANLQLNLSKMADLQGRMSGGKVITKPSDDPGGHRARAPAARREARRRAVRPQHRRRRRLADAPWTPPSRRRWRRCARRATSPSRARTPAP